MTATPRRQTIERAMSYGRAGPVNEHAPDEGAGDEDASVGGEDPPEVRVGLQGGLQPVQAEAGERFPG